MKRFLLTMVGLVGVAVTAFAVPPAELDYQGKVLVNDLPFSGQGYFKFAIANEDGSANLWANDGTSVGEPSGFLTNEVFNGVFSTVLGAPPMSPLLDTIFGLETNLYLRVWFSSTPSGFAEMLPHQKVVSAPYALNAGLVGGLTATEVRDNSVAAATNAITLAGDVNGPPHANSLGTSVVFDQQVSSTADIEGSKIQAGSLTNRGTLQIAAGSTGTDAIATGHPQLNAYGFVNLMAAPGPNSALTVSGVGAIYVSNVSPSTLQIGLNPGGLPALPSLDCVMWVATNGTLSGPGTIDQPYNNIQMAYLAAAAKYPNQPSAVLVAAGSYSGGLIMNAGSVHVIGMGRAELAQAVSVTVPRNPALLGKQRIENMVLKGPVTLAAGAEGIKLYNTKMMNGLTINCSSVEVQNCYMRSPEDTGWALKVGSGGAIRHIGIYHSAADQIAFPYATVQVAENVSHFEVLWCELASQVGSTVIEDLESAAISPVHLYAHNWIRGPTPATFVQAVVDYATPGFPTIGFYNNTVFGHVGSANAGNPATPHLQYYANNHVHGLINHPGGSWTIGWTQAGAGNGADAANNTEHQVNYPALPSVYRD